jgi:hypothetical protein
MYVFGCVIGIGAAIWAARAFPEKWSSLKDRCCITARYTFETARYNYRRLRAKLPYAPPKKKRQPMRGFRRPMQGLSDTHDTLLSNKTFVPQTSGSLSSKSSDDCVMSRSS